MKNMFENYDENQKRLNEFLNTNKGETTIKGFMLGPITDYTHMFDEMSIALPISDDANQVPL